MCSPGSRTRWTSIRRYTSNNRADREWRANLSRIPKSLRFTTSLLLTLAKGKRTEILIRRPWGEEAHLGRVKLLKINITLGSIIGGIKGLIQSWLILTLIFLWGIHKDNGRQVLRMLLICRIIGALGRISIKISNLKFSSNRDLEVQIEDIMALKIAAQALNIRATTHMLHIPPQITRRILAVLRANILRVALLLDIRDYLSIINILKGINNPKDLNQAFPLQVLQEDILVLPLKITMRVEIKFSLDQTDLIITRHPSTQDSTIRPRRSSVIATSIVVALSSILQDTINK
jgi:hypothetical protein